MTDKLLSIRNLSVRIPSRFGDFLAVDSVNLALEAGKIHGLVGESGAGKTTIGTAIIGLLEHPATITAGTIELQGKPLQKLSADDYHHLRGRRISMIFQDPQTSLNPLLSISDQLIETICQHRDIAFNDARQTAIDLLQETGIDNAENRIDDYPHQFSGGMRQRVVIALALCTEPDLIIADEPTTALDVSIQKQMLTVIRELAKKRGVGILLITHDIGVIAEVTDEVTVLRYGRVVEHGSTARVLGRPEQTYTRQLMAAVPRIDRRVERFKNIAADDHRINGQDTWQIEGAHADHALAWLLHESTNNTRVPVDSGHDNQGPGQSHSTPILEIQDLSVVFGARAGWRGKQTGIQALDSLTLCVRRGEVLGVVGESGSGKSTLAKAIVGLVPVQRGSMHFNSQNLPAAGKRSRNHPARRKIQMVFQDPYSSLNNRRTVEATLNESLAFYGLTTTRQESRKLIASTLELVGLPQRAMRHYPHQFSGGQRQRIAIARALVARPELLICDEPTSALDVSIQAQILNLLKDLQQALALSIVFISHDLAVVRQMADSVIVLRDGKLLETASSECFFSNPAADYSKQLLRESPSLSLLNSRQW